MKFISLFAGIGGLDLGLERAGMKCNAQVEIDDFCQKILTRHWPDVPKFKDIHHVGKHNLPTTDLICGGFPCQPHSIAGRRKASTDDRDLWGEFARVIRELRPNWVLAENVPGLLSSEAGWFFGQVLRDLAASGYDVEWQSLPAAAFGAPHIRERVFIVAHSFEWQSNLAEQSRQKSIFPIRNGKIQSMANPPNHQVLSHQFKQNTNITWDDQWATEPDVGRVAHGIPARMDRLRSLGNAVVPQIAEWIGLRIMAAQASIYNPCYAK